MSENYYILSRREGRHIRLSRMLLLSLDDHVEEIDDKQEDDNSILPFPTIINELGWRLLS